MGGNASPRTPSPGPGMQYRDSPSEWQSSPSTPPLSPEDLSGQAEFKETARLKLMRVAMQLPYGGSTFCHALSVDVPQSLIPRHVVIGVNKRGVHFFSPQPQRYLHSFHLREVLSSECHQQQLYLKVWVAGGVDIFQFQTASALQVSQALMGYKLAREAKQHHRLLKPKQQPQQQQPVTSTAAVESSHSLPSQQQGGGYQRTIPTHQEDEEDAEGEEDTTGVQPFRHDEELPRWYSAPPQSYQKDSGGGEATSTSSPRTPKAIHQQTTEAEDESSDKATPVYLPAPLLLSSSEGGERFPSQFSPSDSTMESPALSAAVGTPREDTVRNRAEEVEHRRALFGGKSRFGSADNAAHDEDCDSEDGVGEAGDGVRDQVKRFEAQVSSSQAVAATGLVLKSQQGDEGVQPADVVGGAAAISQSSSISTEVADSYLRLPEDEITVRLRELAEENQELGEANSVLEEERRAYLDDLADERERVVVLEQEVARLRALLTAASEERQQAQAASGQLQTVRKLYRDESLLRRTYFNALEDLKGKVRVCIRIRPLIPSLDCRGAATLSSALSGDMASHEVVTTAVDGLTVAYPWKDDPQRQFSYDSVLDGDAGQEAAFEKARPLVQSAIDGYNACVVAYGQTASGKTHTIFGPRDDPGLLPRAARQLFGAIEEGRGRGLTYRVRCTLVEVHLNELHDLFCMTDERPPTPKMDIKRDPQGIVWVQGATMVEVANAEELTMSVACGEERRRKTATKAGRDSSRSHSVFSALIESTNEHTGVTTAGKLTFVDLAGSENVKRTGVEGEHLKEAIAINKSLSALGDVVSALVSGDSHVPYNNHKLTKLLSDGLGGNAKTLMVVTVSPAAGDIEETHSSLQYASRVRLIKNAAKKNQADKEVQRLRGEVKYWRERAVLLPDSRDALDLRDIEDDCRRSEEAA